MRLVYLGFALAVALLYDWLFWKQETGLNFPLFIALYVIVFTSFAAFIRQLRQPLALLLILPICALAFDAWFYRNDFVRFAVPIMETVLLFLYSILLTLQNPGKFHFSFSQIPILRSIDLPFVKWGTMYRDLFRWEGQDRTALYKHIAIGVVVAAPILLLFTFLFVRADEIFARSLESVFHITLSWEMIWRIFRTIALTLLVGSVFYAIIGPEHSLGNSVKSAFKFPEIIVTTVLALLNALFLVFVFIQMKYLFGGAEFVFGANMTFADYARKGFFELAWVVLISAVILLAVYRSFAYHGAPWYVTALQSLLIVQVGLIAVSALRRMNLYQAEYGYTELRLYVEWFIYYLLALLAVSLASLIAKVSFQRFFFAGLIVSLTAFTLVAGVNVDYVITKQNVDRFTGQNKELDTWYISKLSVDALPATLPLFQKDTFARLNANQVYDLRTLFDRFDTELMKRDTWKEFHLGVLFTDRERGSLATDDWESAKMAFKRAYLFRQLQDEVQRNPAYECFGFIPPESVASMNIHSRCPQATVDGVSYAVVLSTAPTTSPTLRLYRSGSFTTAYEKTLEPESKGASYYLQYAGTLIHVDPNVHKIFGYRFVNRGGGVALSDPETIETKEKLNEYLK